MKKIINGSRISFNEDDNNEIMYMDYSSDECVWCFNTNDVITITEDMELFEMLKYIMVQKYTFSDGEGLKSYKNENKLLWYSDCYYDPEDE